MENKPIDRSAVAALAVLILIAAASYNFAIFRSATPEQLIADLQSAASKGDVEGVLSGLTTESRTIVEKSYADRLVLRQAQDEFRQALDERFGKGTEVLRAPDDDLRAAVGRLGSVEVVSKTEAPDGSVALQVKTTIKKDNDKTATVEQKLVARKEDDVWKLALGFPAERSDAERIKTTIKGFTADVRGGKYADRLAAMIALDRALSVREGDK